MNALIALGKNLLGGTMGTHYHVIWAYYIIYHMVPILCLFMCVTCVKQSNYGWLGRPFPRNLQRQWMLVVVLWSLSLRALKGGWFSAFLQIEIVFINNLPHTYFIMFIIKVSMDSYCFIIQTSIDCVWHYHHFQQWAAQGVMLWKFSYT